MIITIIIMIMILILMTFIVIIILRWGDRPEFELRDAPAGQILHRPPFGPLHCRVPYEALRLACLPSVHTLPLPPLRPALDPPAHGELASIQLPALPVLCSSHHYYSSLSLLYYHYYYYYSITIIQVLCFYSCASSKLAPIQHPKPAALALTHGNWLVT